MATVLWRCGSFELDVSRPRVMGVLNLTPDSFSDGGRHDGVVAGLSRARRMLEEGADIIDVGGESTRPGADEVSVTEESARVTRVVAALAEDGACVSIDSRHSEVAAQCVRAGAAIINDVSGFRDPAMIELAASCDAGLVVMHMLGEPRTMQVEPRYADVVSEVRNFLEQRAGALVDAGVDPARIVLDPGIGFGKTLEHNLALLRGLSTLAGSGHPVLVGASRKRFIGAITGQDDARRRLGGSVAAAVFAVERGAAIVRVHDVEETVQALAVWAAAKRPIAGGME